MKFAGLLLVAAVLAMGDFVSQVQALPQFRDAFKEKYVDSSNDPTFKKAFDDAKCNLCHVAHKPKSSRNDYGKALAKFTGGTVKKDLDAAQAAGGDAGHQAELDRALKTLKEAFDKVADEKSPSGKTYGDFIKEGKLPNSQ